MQEALNRLLPIALGGRDIAFTIIDHGSKQRLLGDLPKRLQGYRSWTGEDTRVLVLVDRDDDDCRGLKRRLEAAALAAGFATKTSPSGDGRFQVVNRIVVEELESWFLGDTAALCAAYPRVPRTFAAQAKYRHPDKVPGGAWEALMRLLNKAGHYQGTSRLPKIEVARRVSAHMALEANRSHSFNAFVTGLQALLT